MPSHQEPAVQEYSVPPLVTVPPDANLADAVFTNAAEAPDTPILTRRVGDQWAPVTAKEFAATVAETAAGLIAAGVQPGDRVALQSRTRYEWTVVDYAIWAAGGVTVPVYETSSPDQIAWILSDSGAVAMVVETPAHAATVAALGDQAGALRTTYVLDEGALDQLRAAGSSVSEEELTARRRIARPDSLATIVYTSGTTGRPKGCELTHGNVLFDVLTVSEDLRPLFAPEDAATLLFLPLAHVFARLIQCACVLNRVRMGHSADVKNLVDDLGSFRPTFLLAVPRIFEKLHAGVRQVAHDSGKGKIFDAAEATAIAYSEALDSPSGPSLLLRARHALFDRLVYSKIRARIGGRVQYAVSGGGPLSVRLNHFFRGIGITVLEGYGLTETTAGTTLNLPDRQRIGSIGRPVAGLTVRIDADGEILVKGDSVFRGYWRNDAATADVFTPDGFFRTGDLGSIDADGYVTITGRKKDLIVTAGGKNVAPAVLEDRVRHNPLISQAVVIGDNRPFIAALLTLDEEALGTWKSAHGKPADAGPAELADDPELQAELQKAVDHANEAVSRAEAIRAFRILDADFTEQDGTLTPSLKVKRPVVLERFAGAVQDIYGS
jgi:long-chain acyl-CoA synthetase